MLIAGLAVLGAAILLLLLGWQQEAFSGRHWNTLLSPAGARAYEELRERLLAERMAIDFTYDRAAAARSTGALDEAIRLLDVGYDFLESVAPDRYELIRDLTVYSRMVAALAPLPPVASGAFQLRDLSALAAAAGVVHYFLVTVAERYRLRLFILGRGFRIVLRALRHSRQRIGGPCDAAGAWARVECARHDFHELDKESLASLKVLLLAMSGTAIEPAVVHQRG